MPGRVVEIAEDGRHLSVSRGFLVVEGEREELGRQELGRIPLDDVGVLLVNAHGTTYSNNLLVKLAEKGAAVVLCGANHAPVAWVWPLVGNHIQAARMRAQLAAGKPLAKRLWQTLIKAKIEQQAAVAAALGKPSGAFETLAREVRSGDPDNIEAQAARRYWPLIFGPDFRRDRAAFGVNAMLNYGYTVVRSAVARAVTGAGLHPSIGIHHSNQYNDMCLIDDLLEPFRPLVDLSVVRLTASGAAEVTPEIKRRLAGLVAADMATAAGTTPLGTCLERLAVSLAQAYESGIASLDLPLAPLPLELPGP
jgi:CRISPR-associated protein Cas1